ncbi:MAG: stage III sporulation protein AG [Ruminococcus sp.]|nr:stage III sporulation protein AG [Ruminococcus sp.]MBR1863543.1 stage III sporulation protein AG [Ruminococcus sp.]
MKDIWIRLAEKLRAAPMRVRLIVAAGILGMVLIMLSEVMPDRKKTSEPEEKKLVSTDETELFRKQTEDDLRKMLCEIDGVGECMVYITVEGTTEYVYAEELSRHTDNGENRSDEKYESKLVTIEKNGEKQALVKKVIRPKISGVLIVCTGGGDVRTNERIIRAASTALNISSGRICVEKMN